jgi:L-ascorbate metabolism protein UlaG (beta-lactamase superfamily)
MEITWHGQSCFSLDGESVSIVTDPYGPKIGQLPPLSADIVTVTHDHFDHNYIQAVSGHPGIIKAIGEYFVKGVKITGYPTYHDPHAGADRGRNIVFVIELDGLRVAHLGDLGEPLDNDLISLLHGVDVLLVPVGRHVTIDIPDVLNLVDAVAPKITIPMHYRTPFSPDTSFLDSIDAFCDAIGGCPKPKPQLYLSAGDTAAGQTVVLQVK